MRKCLTIFFLAICFLSQAKHCYSDSTKKSSIRRKLTLALPDFNIYYCKPFVNPNFKNLPFGAREFLTPIENSYGYSINLQNNFRFRIIGLYYNDALGVECLYGGFGGDVGMSAFKKYLDQAHPSHSYGDGNSNGNYMWNSFEAQGLQFGLGYKIHLKSLIIEPKFQLGFESQSNYQNTFLFKENGSNQFIEYSINQDVADKRQHSYHFQLNLERRFSISKKDKRYRLITGFKAEYIYAPYTLKLLISEKPYGEPANVYQQDIKTSFRMFNFGLYIGFMIKK